MDDTALDLLNEELRRRLQERGTVVLSSTRIRGRFALRLARRSSAASRAYMALVFSSVVEIGKALLASTLVALA